MESELLIKELTAKSEINIKNFPFLKGKLKNHDLLFCITGIGKVNAAIASTLAFQSFSITKSVISGVAGAYPSSGINVGDIVVAEKEINADEGLLIDNRFFIFMNSEEISLFVPNFLNHLRKGVFLTVSACTGTLERAKFLENNFNAICENMEGFSIAKSAKIHGVPAIEIRSISNIVTNRCELLKMEDVRKNAEVVQEFILDFLPHFDLL